MFSNVFNIECAETLCFYKFLAAAINKPLCFTAFGVLRLPKPVFLQSSSIGTAFFLMISNNSNYFQYFPIKTLCFPIFQYFSRFRAPRVVGGRWALGKCKIIGKHSVFQLFWLKKLENTMFLLIFYQKNWKAQRFPNFLM